jgi:hypothetical protein
MENVQRVVMLLKPDGHIPGQWDSGATLKISAMPGGIAVSYQSRAALGEECVLALFKRNGSEIEAGRITGTGMQAKLSGVRLADVAGAAVLCQGSFILKSSGLSWPDIIARYRFAHTQPGALPAEAQAADAPAVQETQIPQAAPSVQEPAQQREAPPEPQSAPFVGSPDASGPPVQPFGPERSEDCPQGIRQSHIDPFPGVFPGSEWVKVSYPGPAGWWHYIFGRACVEGCDADAIGVPGDYSMAPPVWLDGFSTYIRCTSGDARGYWLMFQDAQTGRVLDINRFRHGG